MSDNFPLKNMFTDMKTLADMTTEERAECVGMCELEPSQ